MLQFDDAAVDPQQCVAQRSEVRRRDVQAGDDARDPGGADRRLPGRDSRAPAACVDATGQARRQGSAPLTRCAWQRSARPGLRCWRARPCSRSSAAATSPRPAPGPVSGAWLLVVVGLLAERKPLPSGRLAWLAIGALAAFAAWTLLSVTWAPIAGSAYGYGQIAVLYTGCAARRRDPAQAARRRLARRAGDGGRGADRDRLRALGAAAPRGPALRALDQRPGAPRAAT